MNFWVKIILLNWTCIFVVVHSINSYIYLPDKTLKEELGTNSFVANIAKELEKKEINIDIDSTSTFTLLDDSKISSGNSLFKLDAFSGILTTKQTLDREHMCSSRQCADACDSSFHGMCRINLKVLVMPSYNILNFNVFVEDINDNQPYFSQVNVTQYINENVPIGYKVPINLAYDRDFGSNTIQRYEITKELSMSKREFDLITSTFKLAQNLNESQLHLVVVSELDREKCAAYNFTVTAYDGGRPILSAKLNLNIVIVDINDNNPVFEHEFYKFSVSEETKVDTMIGQVKAVDLDQGQNGLIKYSFVDNSNRLAHQNTNLMNNNRFVIQKSGGMVQSKQQSLLKYFDLNERTGVIRLKTPLDYEDESHFSLIVEARDEGEGSLPTYANVDIDVIDTNDNEPEISVSFLNTLKKTISSYIEDNEFKYDVYVPEHTKTNKFIAHVSITDKDSNENGKIDWMILVNEKVFESSNQWVKKEIDENDSVLKLVKLNNNSFTLNIGNSNLLDFETNPSFNVTIRAWDYGTPNLPQTVYKFTLKLIDINDNAPKFEQHSYDISIHENNDPLEVIFKFIAVDTDSTSDNSNLSYSIKETEMREFFDIDSSTGNLISRIRFDREKRDKYIFHVIVTDNGATPLFATAQVTLNILDLNDNYPIILFNTSYYHRFFLNKKQNKNDDITNNILESSHSILLRIGENVPIYTDLIDFRAYDHDLSTNEVKFSLEIASHLDAAEDTFEISPDGRLTLIKSLEKNKQSIYELTIICQDYDGGVSQSLSTNLKLVIEIVHLNEFCIKGELDDLLKTRFFNRDQKHVSQETLFVVDYRLTNINTPKPHLSLIAETDQEQETNSRSGLGVDLLSHKDLIKTKVNVLENGVYRLQLTFKDINTTRLMLGKYTLKLRLYDEKSPSCTKLEQFNLLIGNNLINEKEIVSFLQTLKQKKNEPTPQISSNQNKLSNEILLNDDLIQNEPPKTTDLAPSLSFNENGHLIQKQTLQNPVKMLKSDYILLFILIVIVVITSILFVFIAILCIYGKLKKRTNVKKQHQTVTNLNQKSTVTIANEDDDDDQDSDNFLTKSLHNKKLKKNKKLIFKTTSADLNSSSSSNTSSDALGSSGKPQYTLVNNGSNSSTSGATSNTTLMYRDPEDDDFVLNLASPTNTFKKKKQSCELSKPPTNNHHNHHQHQSRYIYSPPLVLSTSNKLSSFENTGSNRLNSAGDSFEADTTIDDSKSSGSNPDYELTNISQIKTESSLSTATMNTNKFEKNQRNHLSEHSHSSAYGSMCNSENIVSDTEIRNYNNNKNNIDHNTIVYLEDNKSCSRNKLDPSMLSFKKGGVLKSEVSTFNSLLKNSNSCNVNSINITNKNFNNSNFNPKSTVGRTTFNL